MHEHRVSALGFVRRLQWTSLQSPSREMKSQTRKVVEALVTRLAMEKEFEGARARTSCLGGR